VIVVIGELQYVRQAPGAAHPGVFDT